MVQNTMIQKDLIQNFILNILMIRNFYNYKNIKNFNWHSVQKNQKIEIQKQKQKTIVATSKYVVKTKKKF